MEQYRTGSPEETMEIGHRLGRRLKSGDIVGLYGDLGTGKTVFVKGIAKAFGIAERDITSASFTIIVPYETYPPFTHIDLYRITKTEETAEIGISDHLGGDSVTVVEWAEKAEGWLPEDHIVVRFECITDTVRVITIDGLYEKSRDYIENRTP